MGKTLSIGLLRPLFVASHKALKPSLEDHLGLRLLFFGEDSAAEDFGVGFG